MAGQAETQPVEDTADSIGALLDNPGETEEVEQPEGEQEETEETETPEGEEESEESEGDDAEGDDEKDEDEPTETIKHDGKEVTLKKSEILELAQKGFDYTKKTMALADERKAFDGERERITQEAEKVSKTREQATDDLRAINQFIEGILGEPPDISLAQQDASLYLVKRQQHDQLRDKLSQVRQALTIATQQAEAERQSRQAEKQAATERELIDTLPGWKENPKAKFEETASYLQSLGLNGKNAGSAALEPGFWRLAVKAQAFDQLQQKKATAKPEAKPTKVTRPGAANPVNQHAESMKAKLERARKAPSLESIGDLL
jgi:hypothetical protein